MKIIVKEGCYKVELDERLDTVHEFAGFSNPLEVKNRFLANIEESFDNEIARLLEEGSFRKYSK